MLVKLGIELIFDALWKCSPNLLSRYRLTITSAGLVRLQNSKRTEENVSSRFYFANFQTTLVSKKGTKGQHSPNIDTPLQERSGFNQQPPELSHFRDSQPY